MDYPTYQAKGWAIGSGPIESACKTVIGWGAPTKAGTAATHGEALGVEEVAGARKKLGWTAPPFEVPAELRAAWNHDKAGRAAEARWQELFSRYRNQHPALASEFERRMRSELPANWPDTARAAVAHTRAPLKRRSFL